MGEVTPTGGKAYELFHRNGFSQVIEGKGARDRALTLAKRDMWSLEEWPEGSEQISGGFQNARALQFAAQLAPAQPQVDDAQLERIEELEEDLQARDRRVAELEQARAADAQRLEALERAVQGLQAQAEPKAGEKAEAKPAAKPAPK